MFALQEEALLVANHVRACLALPTPARCGTADNGLGMVICLDLIVPAQAARHLSLVRSAAASATWHKSTG
jgi:hypothetical protein